MKKNRMAELDQLGTEVENAVGSIHKLLDNLLSWALVQESRFPYHPQALLAADILNKELEIYREIAAEESNKIRSRGTQGSNRLR